MRLTSPSRLALSKAALHNCSPSSAHCLCLLSPAGGVRGHGDTPLSVFPRHGVLRPEAGQGHGAVQGVCLRELQNSSCSSGSCRAAQRAEVPTALRATAQGAALGFSMSRHDGRGDSLHGRHVCLHAEHCSRCGPAPLCGWPSHRLSQAVQSIPQTVDRLLVCSSSCSC